MPLIEEIFEDNVETSMKEDSVKVKIEVVEDKENNRNLNNTNGMFMSVGLLIWAFTVHVSLQIVWMIACGAKRPDEISLPYCLVIYVNIWLLLQCL